MRILLLHNKYQYAGGEDKVFESEGELLSRHNHQVERLVFDNSLIDNGYGQIAIRYYGHLQFQER